MQELIERIAALEAQRAELLTAAEHCLGPLEWARDNIDQLLAEKVQRNIDAIKAAIAKART